MATELTPQQKRQQSTKAFTNQLNQGYRAGGVDGMLAAFMGVPNMVAGRRIGDMPDVPAGSYQWPTNYPGSPASLAPAKPPTTGGDLPPVGTNKPAPLPGDQFKLNLIPEWWKEWYRTQGQNGAMPPVDGLL